MASSSSSSWRYHVFPSFSGQDVRISFLSHLLRELGRKSIDTFIDNSIERSLPIDPALLLAIKESKISIVIFSKNYASSTWCLNELVAIHKCFKELEQMVIPIFFHVAPSDVGKQTGEFGKVFEETCKGQPEDHKERWMQALSDVAKMAGYDLLKWPDEANLIESLTNDVSNKLFTPSSDVGDFVGLEAHLERLSSKLCLESEESRMVGIVGPSGIGKSTIGRALYSQHFSKFHHHAIVTYKRTINDDYGMKLSWEQQFLSKILGQNDIKIDNLGEVEKRLKHKKVLIVLDDVVELELLKTLVGKTEWFGTGSRIIVITQNRQLLIAHKIAHIYVVEFPSGSLALEMLCRYAFGKNSPPDGFWELAVEVAKLAGNLPLGLSVLGSSLIGKGKDEWVEMMPRLRNDSDGRIEKTLRVSYDRLDKKDKELFLSIACFFKGKKVSVIEDLFGSIGLRMLADKFLIRITPKEYIFRISEKTPEETVEMHDLLQKLGIEIDCEESERQPSRRRFLTNAEDIRDVLTDKNGTKTVLGISLEVTEPISIDENSFKGMPNLQYIIFHQGYLEIEDGEIAKVDLPQGISYFPRQLKLLKWDYYPAKCLPSNFNAKYLVKLRMRYSKLEKLWEGNQPLGSLKKMDMSYSYYLKEIPDLSNAKNLKVLDLQGCESLVTLPSSFQFLESLVTLNLLYCKLTEIPDLSNAKNLKVLNLQGCKSLVTLPSSFQSLESLVKLNLSYCTKLTEIPDLSNAKNLEVLDLERCESLVTLPSSFQSLESLVTLNLSYCKLTEIPDLSNAKNLEVLNLQGCKSLVTLPSSFQSLESLVKLSLTFCTKLTEIPDLSNAKNLKVLDLQGCESLVTLPSSFQSLESLVTLNLSYCTKLTEIPDLSNAKNLEVLNLQGCKSLVTLPSSFQSLESLVTLYLSYCKLTEIPDLSNAKNLEVLNLQGCESLVTLPSSFQSLESLVTLNLSYCTKLTEIPDLSNAKNLEVLDLERCESLVTLPSSFQSLESLVTLNLSYCTKLTEIPDLSNAKNLEVLDLERCESLVTLPSSFQSLESLVTLNLSYCTKLTEIPDLSNAKNLEVLDLERCESLVTLPSSFQSLESLVTLYLSYCKLTEIPDLSNAKNLEVLNLQGCESLVTLPSSFQSLESLVKLSLSYCTKLTEIPDLSNAKNLKVLDLQGCESLVTLPSSFQSLESLVTLNLSYCTKLTEIPDLSNAKNLEVLDLERCESLVTLPSSFQSLESLVKLNLSYCTKLSEIPDLSNAKNLEVLNFQGCNSLVTLSHLNLESLKVFNLKGCCKLTNFPQISLIMTNSFAQGIKIEVEDCLWDKNLRGHCYLDCLMKCIPSKFRREHVVELTLSKLMHEKLWLGDQSLESLVMLQLSLCMKLTEFPDLSKATNLKRLIIRDCESLVRVPSTIGNLQKLKEFDMSSCVGLEVLSENVNLASLSSLNLRECSRLRTFPQILKSIKTLDLSYTAIEEVPCCIDNFSGLTSLKMHYCESLKNICPNIFRLTRLQVADFSNCAMATMEGHFSYIPLYGNIEKRYHVEKRSMNYFNFSGCSKLDGGARELILRSCFKFMVLPGGEVPTYFKHRASGNNITVKLPQSSLSQEFLRFQVCVVAGDLIKHKDAILTVHFYFNDEYEYEYEVTAGSLQSLQLWYISYTDHLVSCSFKFQPTVLPSKLDLNVVKFKFSSSKLIKGCGVQLLSISPYPDISNGSSETEYNQQFGEKADVVETGRSKKRMQMTSGTSEGYFNFPFGQNIADTRLSDLDLELSLGQGEVSLVSSYPCVEGEALITELQDAEIPVVDKSWKERAFKLSEPLPEP